jgi:hypothetical protein
MPQQVHAHQKEARCGEQFELKGSAPMAERVCAWECVSAHQLSASEREARKACEKGECGREMTVADSEMTVADSEMTVTLTVADNDKERV